MSEQPPQPPETGAGPETAPDVAEVDRIARLRARAAQPATDPPPADPQLSEPVAPAPADPQPSEPVPTPAPPAPASAPPAAAPTEVSPTTTPATTPATAGTADAHAAPPVAPAAAAGPDDYAASRGHRLGRAGTSAVAAVTVLAVLAVVTVALAGLVGAKLSSINAVDRTRGDVVSAATSGVASVLSYDYRHLDTDFARAQGLLTPKFRKQYDDTTAKGVRPLATKSKAISSADVSAAGVVDAGRDRAVVLVFVNQTVTNSQLAAPRLDRSRIKVSLVRSHGRWLIDKLTTL